MSILLKIARDITEISYTQMCEIYETTILADAATNFGAMDSNLAVILAQQDLYGYLRQVFFKVSGARCGFWIVDDVACAALRIEPYDEGYLISGLETAPDKRRKGYAEALVRSTVAYLFAEGVLRVYAHVMKENISSMNLHSKVGFQKISEKATFIDGTVSADACTFCLKFDWKDSGKSC